jgi:hypothetical protein
LKGVLERHCIEALSCYIIFTAGMTKLKSTKKGLTSTLLSTGREYCNNTSIHGYGYWISSSNICERVFWVTIVLIGFSFSGYIVKAAVEESKNAIQFSTCSTILSVPVILSVMLLLNLFECKI